MDGLSTARTSCSAIALAVAVVGCAACERSPEAGRPASPAEPGSPSARTAPAEADDGLRTFGDLRARVIGDGDAGGPLVILLHGYGAPGDDLVGLARRLEVPDGTTFVFPEAPIDRGGSGRAWWMLDEDRLLEGDRDLSGETPPGMDRARRQVIELVRAVWRELGASPAETILGGFSQGAMLALDVALRLEQPVAGVVVLSGTLVSAAQWLPLMEAKPEVRVLVAHGRQDPLLPFAMAERLRDALRDSGMQVQWLPFDGGHTIPPEAVSAAGRLVAGSAGAR